MLFIALPSLFERAEKHGSFILIILQLALLEPGITVGIYSKQPLLLATTLSADTKVGGHIERDLMRKVSRN